MRSGTVIRGIVVFGAAYLLRLAYLSQIARSPLFDFLQLDPLYYHDWAVAIAKGDWLGKEVFEQSPLYPYLLAGKLEDGEVLPGVLNVDSKEANQFPYMHHLNLCLQAAAVLTLRESSICLTTIGDPVVMSFCGADVTRSTTLQHL